MFDLGGGELMLIVLAVLVLFGPKKLPELAQSLGRGMREFKRAQREFTEQINQAVSDESTKAKKNTELKRPEGSVARGDVSPAVAPPDFTEDDVINTYDASEPMSSDDAALGVTTSDPPSRDTHAPPTTPTTDTPATAATASAPTATAGTASAPAAPNDSTSRAQSDPATDPNHGTA